jgi:hypothetical protein
MSRSLWATVLVAILPQAATGQTFSIVTETKMIQYKEGAPQSSPYTFQLGSHGIIALTPGFTLSRSGVAEFIEFELSNIAIQVGETAEGIRMFSLGIHCDTKPVSPSPDAAKFGGLSFNVEFLRANGSVLDKGAVQITCARPPTNVHNSFQPFLGDPTKYAKSVTLTVVGTKP